jgi:PAS domain S-box-containing protein
LEVDEDDMSSTSTSPERLWPAIAKATKVVEAYFAKPRFESERGRIEVDGERYLMVRAASLSVEFFDVVRRLYRDEGEERAFAIAHNLLFDVAHALGRADARALHERFEFDDPFEKVATGPAHFAESGWASVELVEEHLEAGDPDSFLIYNHQHSFEADAWLEADRQVELPVCTMSAGYSSGWVSTSMEVNLVASEITCRARGDHDCSFVMAHPDRIEDLIEARRQQGSAVVERVDNFRIPGFFVRKRFEDALDERDAQYRGVFEASTDALLIVSDNEVVGANHAAEQLLGRQRNELIGEAVEELVTLSTDFATIEKVTTGGDIFESEVELGAGAERRHVEVRASAYHIRSHPQVLLSLRDITRQKQMQQQLYRADRLASLGTMAAGVAHEINNPLSFIISNLEVTLWEIDHHEQPDLRDLREAIARAKKGAERVERTVRDLTNFSHGGLDDSIESIDVHRMLDLAAQMVEKTIEHKGGRLIKHYGDVPSVLANEARLNQVFVNLLLNAAQALPEAGDRPNEVEITTDVDQRWRVVVSIRDTGTGIPESVRSRIFDPFFTTKPVDQGTGIGLSICHEIIQAIGGQISLNTEVGKGTTFRVALPTQTHLSRGLERP